MQNAVAASSPERAQEEWCIKLRKAGFPGCTLSLCCCRGALRASASRRARHRRRRSGSRCRRRRGIGRRLKPSKACTDMVAMEHNMASARFQVAHCPHHVPVQGLAGHFAQAWPPWRLLGCPGVNEVNPEQCRYAERYIQCSDASRMHPDRSGDSRPDRGDRGSDSAYQNPKGWHAVEEYSFSGQELFSGQDQSLRAQHLTD